MLTVLQHNDTFDERPEEQRALAARLASMLYWSGDMAMSREKARELSR